MRALFGYNLLLSQARISQGSSMPDTQSRDREGAGEPAMDGSRTPLPRNAKRACNPRALHSDDVPAAYLITFTCYGTWVRGDKRGAVDRHHNQPGTAVLAADTNRVSGDRERLAQPAYRLDETRRELVLKALRDVCQHREWPLLAVHVRTSHVHAVVAAFDVPERIMNDFKAYGTRALNRSRLDDRDAKRWTRHGSTRRLWRERDVEAAIRYVIDEQGEPMAVFVDRSAVAKLENELEAATRERLAQTDGQLPKIVPPG